MENKNVKENSVIMLMNDKIGINLTCELKDVSTILSAMKDYAITFEKRHTTLHDQMESTMTFSGIKADIYTRHLMDFLCKLHELAEEEKIGTIYVYMNKKEDHKKNKIGKTVTANNDRETPYFIKTRGDYDGDYDFEYHRLFDHKKSTIKYPQHTIVVNKDLGKDNDDETL